MNRAFFLFLFFSISVLFAQNTDRFDVINLSINSNENEFATALAHDGSIFYLKSHSRNSNFYDEKSANLYKGALMSKGEFSSGHKFPTNATHAVFTNDGTRVYYSKKEGDIFQLFTAQIDRTGRWKNPTKLSFNNSSYTFKHPALNLDNTKLYFASNMPGSYGKTDIYYVTINKYDRGFSKPTQLGKNVNSSGVEIYPFIGDNDKLYFSSDSASSLGGLDIFESFYENGKYVKTSNLGSPINSKKDDFAYILVTDSNKGYFSSNRTDGHGGVDIYYFKDRKPLINKCSGEISGIIRNKNSKKAIFEASVEVFSPHDHIGTVLTNIRGEFSFNNIECEEKYDVVSYKEGYNGFAEVQTVPNEGRELNLYLNPEHPKEFEEEFDFSSEMVVYNTQTKEVMTTEADVLKEENDHLSFAEKREIARLEKEEKKRKQIEQEKETELIRKAKEEEIKLATIEEQRITVEKEKVARLEHAKKVAENLRKEKEVAEIAEKQQIEKEIIAQEKARVAQEEAQKLAEEKARQEKIEAERLTQREKEKQLHLEADRIAEEEESKKQLEEEKQQRLITQKEAIVKERQERIAKAKATAERLKEEKEQAEIAEKQQIENEIIAQEKARVAQEEAQKLAEEKANLEKIEAERLAQIEKEKQMQLEADRIADEEDNKQNLEKERQQKLIAQKEAIEKERQERIDNAKATAERIRKENEIAEQRRNQELAVEKAKQDAIEAEKLAEAEKNEQLHQALADRLAAEEENNKQLENERQQQLIAQKEAIEKERQERIANAKATAERIRKENEIAEQKRNQELAEEKAIQDAIEAEKIAELEKDEQLKQALADRLATEEENNKQLENERQQQLIAQKEAIEKERQERIANAKATAERIRKENQIAEQRSNQELAEEKAIQDAIEAEKLAEAKKNEQLHQALADRLVAEEENNKQLENERQQRLIAQREAIEKERQERIAIAQATAKRMQKEKELKKHKRDRELAKERARQDAIEKGRCSRNISGVIQSSFDNSPIADATVDIYYDGQNLESITTDEYGEFHFYNTDCDTKYTLICFKKDYNNIAKADINTDHLPDQVVLILEPDPEIEMIKEEKEEEMIAQDPVVKKQIEEKIVMQKIIDPIKTNPETQPEIVPEIVNSDIEVPKIIGKKIQLNPIYFELDEWYLTLSARRELDKLIVLMHQNETMIVESGSHTDTRGPFNYNLELSEKRSQETVGYLVANGVDPDRISGRGYGESIPVNHCIDGVRCSDKQHIENRRTEFIILKH